MTKPDVKNDGHDLERFQALAKKLISVPKKEIDAREKAAKDMKAESGRKPVNG